MPDNEDKLAVMTEDQMIRMVGCIGRATFLSTEGQQIMMAVQSRNGKITTESADKYLHDFAYRFRAISDEVLSIRRELVGEDLISEDVINQVQDLLGDFDE